MPSNLKTNFLTRHPLMAVFLFTFINGGGTIISTLAAAAIYKEKLSVYSILGVIIGNSIA